MSAKPRESVFGMAEYTHEDSTGIPLEWKQSPIFGITGLVAWTWHVREKKVVYSHEWRNVLLKHDDDKVQTEVPAWWLTVHEDDVQPFLEASRDIVEGHTDVYQSLFRVRRSDGVWAWLLSRGRVVESDGHGPRRVCGTIMDCTFLRHDAKFLHGNAHMIAPRLHVQPPDAHPGPAGLSPEPRRPEPARLLPPSAGMHIFSDPEAVPLGNMMEPAQYALVRGYVKKAFADGIPVREIVTFATGNASTITGEYSVWPVPDQKGKITAVVTQFRDLTDQLIAERRAWLNEMRLDALYRLTQISGASEDEVMAYAIESLVRLTESQGGFLFFPHDATGRKGRMVWSRNQLDPRYVNGDTLPEELAGLTTSDTGQIHRPVIRNGNYLQPVLRLFDGSLTLMRYIAAPVFDRERLVCIAAAWNKEKTEYRSDDLSQLEAFVNGAWLVLRRQEDIRELHRAKEAAERAKDTAETANKVKDEFLANVSHELRTPLNGILSMLQLLDDLPLNDQQREYVDAANSSGKALLRIISDILDFARIESNKMQLHIERFDFITAFESSLDLFRRQAEEKGLDFEVAVGEGIPRSLLGDDARVRQILFNIVGNALKFTEQGGIRVECSRLPHAEPGHATIYLAVADTGIGIPEKQQQKIFNAFTQVHNSPSRKYNGTGLGLGIVRHLVRLMRGSITIDSVEGEGSTVHCALRFALPDTQKTESEFPEAIRTTAVDVPLQILVAEDDAISRFAIQKFLQKLGHVPVCAENGHLALEMLQLHPFSCLFTDIQMPDMDGLEVVRRIRENRLGDIKPSGRARELLQAVLPGDFQSVLPVPRDTLTVAVSAHTMQGDKERFLKAGMDFFISKPVIMKDLSEILAQISARLGAVKSRASC